MINPAGKQPCPPPTPIAQIQGAGAASPYVGQEVLTGGIVTAKQDIKSRPGFYMQDPMGDGNMDTSEGIFVSTKGADPALQGQVKPGDSLLVHGVIEENGMTTLAATKAELIPPVDGAALEMPKPVDLNLPPDLEMSNAYLGAREGMLATVPNAMVIEPTDSYKTFMVVDAKVHGPRRAFDSASRGERLPVSGALGISQFLTTGDQLHGMAGPVTYNTMMKRYELLQSKNPSEIVSAAIPPNMYGDITGDDKIDSGDIQLIQERVGKQASGLSDAADLDADGKITCDDVGLATKRAEKMNQPGPQFTVVTMNSLNDFDTINDPNTDDNIPTPTQYSAKLARMAGVIRNHLKSPDLMALEEVENIQVLHDLAERPELKSQGYTYTLLPGTDPRGINTALFYKGDFVNVSNPRQTNVQLPSDREPPPATYPLFSRPPLSADVTVKKDGEKLQFTIIANHLKSKVSKSGGATDPVRVAQAEHIAQLVDDIRREDPNRGVIVLGDLNDTADSNAVKHLIGDPENPRMVNTGVENTPPAERYSYTYNGEAQLIDHILATPDLNSRVLATGIRHVNSDIPYSAQWNTLPYGASDHDVAYTTLSLRNTQPEVCDVNNGEALSAVNSDTPAT